MENMRKMYKQKIKKTNNNSTDNYKHIYIYIIVRRESFRNDFEEAVDPSS